MPKRIQPPFDVKSFMEHGDQFHFNMIIIRKQPEDEFPMLVTPWVVSAAFALEVYFKVLAHLERKLLPLKTHNLLHLFEDISAQSQMKIEAEWTTQHLPRAFSDHSGS